MDRVSCFLNSGQSLVQAAVLHGELLRVDTHAVEDRRVDVANVYGIPDDIVPEVVGLAVRDSPFDAATGHPD